MTASDGKTALIIGASRGLGCALAAEYLERGRQVTDTVRGTSETELHRLAASSDRLTVESVDITLPEEVEALHDRLTGKRFDLLFVNAGTADGAEKTTADVSTETFAQMMVTNALSPLRVIEKLQDLVPSTARSG